MKKVYLIDDDVFVTKLYENMLKRDGIQAISIHSGEDAIQRILTDKPDLVVLDLHMPDFSGIDVLRFIRYNQLLKDIYVIVLSNGYVKAMVADAGEYEVQKFISKLQSPPKVVLQEIKKSLAELDAAGDKDIGLDAAADQLDDIPIAELPRYFEQMSDDVRLEEKRNALVHVYKIMNKSLQVALAVDENKPQGQLARVLKVMLEDVYAHPDRITETTRDTLSKGLNKLDALSNAAQQKLASEAALEELLDDLE